MGFSCDACGVQPAELFCFTHRQSLCQACDGRVHTSGRGQPKHERVALTGHQEATQCDICQEDSAIMFCAEDRALICRRCDLMIHTANEFTRVHHRYILSGFAAGLQALEDPQPIAVGSTPGPPAVPALPSTTTNLSSRSSSALLDMSAAAAPNGITFPTGLASADGSGGGASGSGIMGLDAVGAAAAANDSAAAAANSGAGGSSGEASANRLGSVTLASDLLGMPSLPDNYNVKDVDAAWGDAGLGGLEEWSQYLEVPDLGFLDNLDGDHGDNLFPPDLFPLDGGDAVGGASSLFEQPNVSVRAPDLVASNVPSANNLAPAENLVSASNVPPTNNVPQTGNTAAVVTSGSSDSLRQLQQARGQQQQQQPSQQQPPSQQLPHVVSLPRGLSREASPAHSPAHPPPKMTVTSGDTGSSRGINGVVAGPATKRARMG